MSLLITIPVCADNVARLADFTANVRHQSGLQSHRILIVSSRPTMDQAQEAAKSLMEVCPEVDVVNFGEDPVGRRSFVSNAMLYGVARLILARATSKLPLLPWFYCPLSCTPLCGETWDRLETAYNRGGRRFLGYVQEIRPGEGKMMIQAGIWPGDIGKSGAWALLRVVNKGYSPHQGHEPPFAAPYIGGEVMKDGCLAANDLFVFEPDSQGIEKSPDSKTAVMHIGCQDGSLARLLVGFAPGSKAEYRMSADAQYPRENPPPLPREVTETLTALKDVPRALGAILNRLEAVEQATGLGKFKGVPVTDEQPAKETPEGDKEIFAQRESAAPPEDNDEALEIRPDLVTAIKAHLATGEKLTLEEAANLVMPPARKDLVFRAVNQRGSKLEVGNNPKDLITRKSA